MLEYLLLLHCKAQNRNTNSPSFRQRVLQTELKLHLKLPHTQTPSNPDSWSTTEGTLFREFRKLHDDGTSWGDIAKLIHQTALYRGWQCRVFESSMLSRRNYELKRESIEKTSVDKPWTGEEIALFLEFSRLHPETTLSEISDLMQA